MRVLALETSGTVASAAVQDDNKLLGEITFNYKKQHSTILMPMIDKLLTSLDLDIKDMDSIACSSGPGSFTGLRIGAATAKGLCQGIDKPLIGVPTLDGLAFNIMYSKGIVCPMIDALRNNVYTCIYRWDREKLVRLDEYMAVSIDEIIEKLKNYNEDIIFLADGASLHREILSKEFSKNAFFAQGNLNMQKASSICSAALIRLREGDVDNYIDFAPFYIRKSQAEREYENRKGGSK